MPIQEDYNSVLLTPNFPAFRDCMDYALTINSSYTGSYDKSKNVIISESEILKRRIKCQFLKNSHPDRLDYNFDNVSLTPSTSKHCTWEWVKNRSNKWGGVFNVTLHQNKQQVVDTSSNNQSNAIEENVTMALTCSTCISKQCTLISADHSSRNIREPAAVIFAMPFIFKPKIYTAGKTLLHHPNVESFIQTPWAIVLAGVFSSLLFLVLIIGGYKYFKRKADSR